jgi:hypothetical protein
MSQIVTGAVNTNWVGNAIGAVDHGLQGSPNAYFVKAAANYPQDKAVPVPKTIDMRIKTASNGLIIELYPSTNDSPSYRTPSVLRVVTDASELGAEITAALVEAKLLETT